MFFVFRFYLPIIRSTGSVSFAIVFKIEIFFLTDVHVLDTRNSKQHIYIYIYKGRMFVYASVNSLTPKKLRRDILFYLYLVCNNAKKNTEYQ